MFSPIMILLALTSLGLEPVEGGDPATQLDAALKEYGLDTERFLTEEACFSIGYHRGMVGAPYSDEQIPTLADGKVDPVLEKAVEQGYPIGLEARELKLTPPPGLVFRAWKDGLIKAGEFEKWAATIDLSAGNRLSVAITVGSGKTAQTIPAGTPVDVLAHVEKDGVDHVVVLYDGRPLIVPNPEDSPRVISANTAVTLVKAARKGATRKTTGDAGGTGTATTPRAPVERGPTLRDAIIYVAEGLDGGPGPLQSNGQFASRLQARCTEQGIGDKAATFVQKADKHVPYYLNIYGPAHDDSGVVVSPGRSGVEAPSLAVVLKIRVRKHFLKGEGLSFEARYAQIPADLRKEIEAAVESKETIAIPVKAATTPAA